LLPDAARSDVGVGDFVIAIMAQRSSGSRAQQRILRRRAIARSIARQVDDDRQSAGGPPAVRQPRTHDRVMVIRRADHARWVAIRDQGCRRC
jgi:hypothetical protein